MREKKIRVNDLLEFLKLSASKPISLKEEKTALEKAIIER